MREKIDCFLPCDDLEAAQNTVRQLRGNKTIQHIFLLVTELLSAEDSKRFSDCQQILVDSLASSNTIMSIAENANADYALLQTKPRQLLLGERALERALRVASDSDAAMVYADHYDITEGQRKDHPVIDYQIGSVRDDFDFGSLWLIKTSPPGLLKPTHRRIRS